MTTDKSFKEELEAAWSALPPHTQVDLLTSQVAINGGINCMAKRPASPLGQSLLTNLGYNANARGLIPLTVFGEAMVVELPVQEDPIVLLALLLSGRCPAWSLTLSQKRQSDITRAYNLVDSVPARLRPTAYNRIGLPFPKPLGSLPFFAATSLQVNCKALALSNVLDAFPFNSATREAYAIALAGRSAIQLHGVFSKSALINGYGGATAWTGDSRDNTHRKPTSDGCGFCARATKWDNSNLFRDLAPFTDVAPNYFGAPALTSGQAFSLPVLAKADSLTALMQILGEWVSLLRSKVNDKEFEGLVVERLALDNTNAVIDPDDLRLAEDVNVEADTTFV